MTSRPEGHFDETLCQLYAEEPDWNLIIRDLSEAAVTEEQEVGEFEEELVHSPKKSRYGILNIK